MPSSPRASPQYLPAEFRPLFLAHQPIFATSLGLCTFWLVGNSLGSLAHASDWSKYTEGLFLFVASGGLSITPDTDAAASVLPLLPSPQTPISALSCQAWCSLRIFLNTLSLGDVTNGMTLVLKLELPLAPPCSPPLAREPSLCHLRWPLSENLYQHERAGEHLGMFCGERD